MDEESTISAERDQKPRGSMVRIGFELFIVFVGVWGALFAESWRERREENRSAVAVLETALAQLQNGQDWSTEWRDSVRVEYAEWKVRRTQGEMIPPFFMRMPGSEYPPVGIFGAAANLPDALGPSVVREMANRANEMEGWGRRNARYMELTERTVFPRLAADPSTFYDLASGDLLPEYQGQLLLLEEVLAEWDMLDTQGRELARVLEEELRRRR